MGLFVRPHSFGIQARLTMLAVATALPLVALASFAVLRTVDDQRTQIQQDVKDVGGGKLIAWVKDGDGNITGLVQSPR